MVASLVALLGLGAVGVAALARSVGQVVTTDAPAVRESAAVATGPAYDLVAADGSMYRFGQTHTEGDLTGRVGLGALVAVDGWADGFFTITAEGKVFPVGILAEDGALFSFGDAGFHGSPNASGLASPAVAMEASPSGRGYWVVADDGSVLAFGDAPFVGAASGLTQGVPVVDIEATSAGDGYWLVSRTGGVYAFGAAPFLGAAPALESTPTAPIVGLVATAG